MDEKVLEDYGVGKVDELAHEVILQVDEIDKVYEALNEVVLLSITLMGLMRWWKRKFCMLIGKWI